jgi:hypothetical protein
MLIRGNAGEWKKYVEHEFVKQLGAGTLSQKAFTHFIMFVISPLQLSSISPVVQARLPLSKILCSSLWVCAD